MGYIAEAETRASQRALGVVAAVLPPVRDAVELSVMCLPGNKKGKLLDVGCGNGQFLVTMRELG
jgi:2-polyprenyl-3-methyl-5-hydroxy-6-metoxy-1,4-benzoquinol methylase